MEKLEREMIKEKIYQLVKNDINFENDFLTKIEKLFKLKHKEIVINRNIIYNAFEADVTFVTFEIYESDLEEIKKDVKRFFFNVFYLNILNKKSFLDWIKKQDIIIFFSVAKFIKW